MSARLAVVLMAGLPLTLLYPVQREVVETPAVVRVVIAGRGGGKSALASWWAADGAARGGEVLYVAPVRAQYEQALRHLQLLLPPPAGRVSTREDVTRVVHASGGSVELRSGKIGAHLRGGGYLRVVLDEADYIPERSADVVFGGLARGARPCEVLIGTTPLDLPMASWVEGRYKRGLAGDPGHASFSWSAWDVPHTAKTGPGSLAWMRGGDVDDGASREWQDGGGVARDVYEREVLARYVTVRGVRLQREWVERAQALGRAEWSTWRREDCGIGIGVDLAFTARKASDWSAAAVVGRHRSGRLWLLDGARVKGGLDPVVGMLVQLGARWLPAYGWCEARGEEDLAVHALAREVRFPLQAHRPEGDKVARFALVEAAFRRGDARVAPGFPREALEELLSFPLGEHDDYVDAVAYGEMAAPAVPAVREQFHDEMHERHMRRLRSRAAQPGWER